METTSDAQGRGLVVLMPGAWDGWIEQFDVEGYDTVVLARAGDAGPVARRAVRQPVLLGHGRGGRAAYALNGRIPLAAVIAVAPTRSWRRPGRVVPRVPLLLISGGGDRMASPRHVSALARRDWRRFPEAVTDHQVFPGQGHELGGPDVTGFCLDWLLRQGL